MTTAELQQEIILPDPSTYVAVYEMSYEQFLAWSHEGGLAEWVDGKVYHYMSAKLEHQRIVVFLVTLLRLFTAIFKQGQVQIAPYLMRSEPGGNGREPDLLFVTTENLARMTSRQLEGPADLVVEVISDDSSARDRDDKFFEYQKAGVREYWIIDPRPERKRADFFVLDQIGRYQPVPLDETNIYRSTVIAGFWLNTNWLWQDDANPLAALAEVVGPERVLAALQNAL